MVNQYTKQSSLSIVKTSGSASVSSSMSRVLAPLRHLLHIMVEWIIGSAIHRAFARLIYLPSIVRLIVREGPKQRWYDRVDDTVILGALPFRSQTKQVGMSHAP